MSYETSLLSKTEQAAYLEGLSDEDFAKLVENARIAEFLLRNLDQTRLNTLSARLPELDILTAQNVQEFLSPAERAALSTFVYKEEASNGNAAQNIEKSCGSWHYSYTSTTCNALLAVCTTCDVYERSCSWWEILASRTDYRNCYSVHYLD